MITSSSRFVDAKFTAAATVSSPSAFIDALESDGRVCLSESDCYRAVATSLNNSGAYQHTMENHEAALKLYQEACGVREEAVKLDELRQSMQQQQPQDKQSRGDFKKRHGVPNQPNQSAHFDDKTKGGIQRLEDWVRQVATEEYRLCALADKCRRMRRAAVLDLFPTDLNDTNLSAPRSEDIDMFDWSLGSNPIFISNPKPSSTSQSNFIGTNSSREQQDYVDACTTLFNMGLVHMQYMCVQQQADHQAHGIFEMTLSVLPPEADPILYAHLLNHLALAQARMDRTGDAICTLNRALKFEQKHFNSVGRPSSPSWSAPDISSHHDFLSNQMIDVATCVSDTLSLLARAHRALGQPGRAAEIATECLRVRTARLGEGNDTHKKEQTDPRRTALVHPDTACGWHNLGIVLVEGGRAEEGIAYLDSFVDWVKAVLECQSGQAQAGNQHQHDHGWERAFLFSVNPKTADQVSWALHTVALHHLDLCFSVTRALIALNLSLSIRKRYLGDYDPTVAFTLHSLGRLYSTVGSVREAMGCYRAALAIFRSAVGNPDIAAVLCDIGHLHHDQGEVDEALASFREALRVARIEHASAPTSNQEGDNVDSIIELLRVVGNIQLEQGNSSGAVSSFAEAERMARSASHLAPSQAQRQLGGRDQPAVRQLLQSALSSSGASVPHPFCFCPCSAAA